jgi:hypothetical protein
MTSPVPKRASTASPRNCGNGFVPPSGASRHRSGRRKVHPTFRLSTLDPQGGKEDSPLSRGI